MLLHLLVSDLRFSTDDVPRVRFRLQQAGDQEWVPGTKDGGAGLDLFQPSGEPGRPRGLEHELVEAVEVAVYPEDLVALLHEFRRRGALSALDFSDHVGT